MIGKLARDLTSFYVKKTVISNNDAEVYAYGFELLISSVLTVSLVAGIAFFFHLVPEAIIYTLSFILFRRTGGGYHAKTHGACITACALSFFSVVSLLVYLPKELAAAAIPVCAAATLVVVWKLAPVEAANKPMSAAKNERLKKRCRLTACVFMLLALSAYIFPVLRGSYLESAFYGEAVAGASMVLAGWNKTASISNREEDRCI